MESCDVLVVGGGPAGSTCAARLEQAGLDVLVVDRAQFPRDKPCAGWITPAVLEVLGLTPDECADGRTFQPFTGFRTGLIGGPWVETDYERPVSFGILRREFDDFLLRRSGARLRGGFPVTQLRRLGDAWIVNEEIRTPIVVGAGGHLCPIARYLNEPARPAEVVAARELEFRMDGRQQAACRVRGELPQIFFSRDLQGYGWCVRKGEHLNVGLGRRAPGRLNEHLRQFLTFLRGLGEIPDLPSSGWRGYAYRLHEGAPRRLVDDGMLLLGDAAGLAAAASGEGIRPAVESGFLAGVAIVDAGGRSRREDLEPYRSALEAAFGRRRPMPGGGGRIVTALAPLMLGARWFARHFVLDRWFLQTRRRPIGAGPFPRRAPAAARRAS